MLGLIVPLTAYSYNRHGNPALGVDDANIFFVYAEHLTAGHGFVYNVGGERVEGFTSLLWVLLCAPFFATMQRPEGGVLAVSTLLVAVTHTVATTWLDGPRPAATVLRRHVPTLATVVYLVQT